MIWTDNYWLLCDNKERRVCAVNDMIEELMDGAQARVFVVDEHALGEKDVECGD